MSDLRGAEFAPSIVVGYVTERGGFYATLDSVPMITPHKDERVKAPYMEAVRRLSCDDPDDQRAIWRLAALAMGATADEASTARLARSGVTGCLHLFVDCGGGVSRRSLLWRSTYDVPQNRTACTAALCAHVWGPK